VNNNVGNIVEEIAKTIGQIFELIGKAGKIGIAIFVVIVIFSALYDDKEEYVEQGENAVENIENAGEIIYETGKESVPVLLEIGGIYCNVDDFILDEINTSVINFEMKTKVNSEELRILSNMEMSGNGTACQVAILDDMLPNSETGDTIRNQIGIKKAMKNIKGCTLIACADEYNIIKYLEDEK
jgi:hypothetical protein